MAGRQNAGSGAPSPAPEPDTTASRLAPGELDKLTAGAGKRRERPAKPDSLEELQARLDELERQLVESREQEDPDDELLAAGAHLNAPAEFALGDAPDPAVFPDPPAKPPRKTGMATHTGTDPHGRAIGPREDHTKPKRDYDGLTAVEAAKRAAAAAEEDA